MVNVHKSSCTRNNYGVVLDPLGLFTSILISAPRSFQGPTTLVAALVSVASRHGAVASYYLLSSSGGVNTETLIYKSPFSVCDIKIPNKKYADISM